MGWWEASYLAQPSFHCQPHLKHLKFSKDSSDLEETPSQSTLGAESWQSDRDWGQLMWSSSWVRDSRGAGKGAGTSGQGERTHSVEATPWGGGMEHTERLQWGNLPAKFRCSLMAHHSQVHIFIMGYVGWAQANPSYHPSKKKTAKATEYKSKVVKA